MLESSRSVLPTRAGCPARKGAASRFPPDALRCRGGWGCSPGQERGGRVGCEADSSRASWVRRPSAATPCQGAVLWRSRASFAPCWLSVGKAAPPGATLWTGGVVGPPLPVGVPAIPGSACRRRPYCKVLPCCAADVGTVEGCVGGVFATGGDVSPPGVPMLEGDAGNPRGGSPPSPPRPPRPPMVIIPMRELTEGRSGCKTGGRG